MDKNTLQLDHTHRSPVPKLPVCVHSVRCGCAIRFLNAKSDHMCNAFMCNVHETPTTRTLTHQKKTVARRTYDKLHINKRHCFFLLLVGMNLKWVDVLAGLNVYGSANFQSLR